MNLILMSMLIMGLLMMTSASFRSAAHTLFIDPSEDPFFDSYIETISHMNTKDIMAIPKMDDNEFLRYLLDDSAPGMTSRAADTSIFNPLRDDQLKHQDEIDKEWETLMVSGPIAVSYMGNLMVLASKRDFPFQAPVGYIYRYIRYPNSIRATLAQVSSDMYSALMGAHITMDKIQSAMKQVPTLVKTAMKLITSAADAMLKAMLPRTLENVIRSATESADQANSTLLRFNQLQDLIAEIIELSASTRSTNGADIEKMKEQKQNSMFEQQRLKESLESIKNQYTQSKANLELVRKKYAEAMHLASISTSSEVIESGGSKSNLLSAAIGLIFEAAKTIGCLLGSCGNPTITVDNSKFENALRLAQLAKEELERAEQIHNEHFQLQLAEQNELANTMNQMAMLGSSQLRTEEIFRLLLETTKQIDLIKEQWVRMVQFFSKLAVQAQSIQQTVVKDFVEVIQQAQTDNLLVNPFDREFFIELFVPSILAIESGAHLLFTMANTYYTVSDEHMVHQIADITKLLMLQTDDERHTYLQQASMNTLITSHKITQLAQERHALYLQETHNRQAEYIAYINNLLMLEVQGLVG